MSIYQSHQHSCFLYLGSIIVDEFGSESIYHEGLLSMLQAYAEVSLPLLAGPSGLIEHPDTVDDMFRLCARYCPSQMLPAHVVTQSVCPCRFIQRCPVVFLSSPAAPTVFQCALAATTLNQRDAFSSVMKFFKNLVQLPQVQGLVSILQG